MQYLNREELKRLIEAMPEAQYRNRLMVLVAFWHGLRASEVCGLKGKDIRNGYVFVKRLKGSNKTNQVYRYDKDPLLNELVLLAKLEPFVKDNELVFPMTRFGFYKLIRRAAVKAGMGEPGKWVRPHILKHSIIKQSINAGMKLPHVQRMAGHKSLASTGVYSEVDDVEADQELAEAMARAS